MAKRKTKVCRWYAGKTSYGLQVKCLKPAKSKYAKPKGTPRSWKVALGPYRTSREAVERGTAQWTNTWTKPYFARRK